MRDYISGCRENETPDLNERFIDQVSSAIAQHWETNGSVTDKLIREEKKL